MQGKNQNKKIKLSARLETIAKMVESCDRVIDVGTDHALVPIYLVSCDICKTAIGTDIKAGPVKRAIKNITDYGLNEAIQILQTDGLGLVEIDKNDCIVISGMGGFEIISILDRLKTPVNTIILQPQKSLYELREFLSKKGFEIVEEKIVKENHRFYIALKIDFTRIKYILSDYEKYVGPRIIDEKPLFYKEYLAHLKTKIKKQIRGNPELVSILNKIESEVL